MYSDFNSKFAYIDNNSLYIGDYIASQHKNQIKCKHGHDLKYTKESTNTVAYFSHKNAGECAGKKMTDWHKEWQAEFKITEKQFGSSRRADVFIEENKIVLELQHSNIQLEEVTNRNRDYKAAGCTVIWLIDGNDKDNDINVVVDEIPSNRVFLTIKKSWIYNSFQNCETVFIDKENLIYKITISNIKSGMIDVCQPITREEFINRITQEYNDKKDYFHQPNIQPPCKLYIKQQGAGNGKTYGIIQQLESAEFEQYDYFIIVTKQHSAKYVICDELKKQNNQRQLKHIKFDTADIEYTNKKYIIRYSLHGKERMAVIGTVDSFICTLGDRNQSGMNMFSSCLNSIKDGFIKNKNRKIINYAREPIPLTKKTCLICDETQDLSQNYAEAIIQIMRDSYIDAYIVGDQLQSLREENNAFNYLYHGEFPYIETIKNQPTNICQRFSHPDLIEFVNDIVVFGDLPKIHSKELSLEENKKNQLRKKDDVLKFFKILDMYKIPDPNAKKKQYAINIIVDQIMGYYDDEVKNGYQANDFLFITPFTKQNPLLDAIETAINDYWFDRNNNTDIQEYAIFHKSEEGTSINLDESKDATRIVSIHTSKGDGRPIVFVIGLSDDGLIKFSGQMDNLIYNSLIHVALTRMKEKIYVGIINEHDDISNKFINYTKKHKIDIEGSCNYGFEEPKFQEKTFKRAAHNELNFKELKDKIIQNSNEIKFNEEDRNIIDMSHHNIRYATMCVCLYIEIIQTQKDCDGVKKQIIAKFHQIKESKIETTDDRKQYNEYLFQSENRDKKILLFNFSKKNALYGSYCKIIKQFMEDVQKKITKFLSNEMNNAEIKLELCPLESIILYFMLEIQQQGGRSDININQLYRIVNLYSKSYNRSYKGHNECRCRRVVKFQNKENDTNQSNMNNYLKTHYDKIQNIKKVYNKFLNKHPNVAWLINHETQLNGTNDFDISARFPLMGYDRETVYIGYIKPQITQLNYSEILIDSIYDSYFIKNIQKPTEQADLKTDSYDPIRENWIKFSKRRVKTILFAIDRDDYEIIDWNIDVDMIQKNCNIIESQMKKTMLLQYMDRCKYIYSRSSIYDLNNPNYPDRLNGVIENLYNINNKSNRKKLYIIKKRLEYFAESLKEEDESSVRIKEILRTENNFLKDMKDYISKKIDKFFEETHRVDSDSE